MSNNPDEPIIQLGVEADTTSADENIDQFSTITVEAMDRIIAQSELLDSKMADATASIAAYNAQLDEINKLSQEFQSTSQTEIDQLLKEVDAYEQLKSARQAVYDQAQQDLLANPQKSNYGVFGGQIGPSEAPDDTGDDTGGGGSGRGNAYAAARAFSGIGRATGDRGFTDVSAAIYAANAFNKISESIGAVNLPLLGMVSGVEALLAVIVPVGIAIGAAAIATASFIDQLKKETTAVDDATKGLEKYYELVASGTQDQIAQELVKQRNIQAGNDQAIAVLQDKLNAFAEEAASLPGNQGKTTAQIAGEFASGNTLSAKVEEQAGIRQLLIDIDKLRGTSTEAANAIDRLNAAYNSADAKSRSFIANLDQLATDYEKTSQLIKTATTKQVQDQLDANAVKEQATKDEMAVLSAAYAEGKVTLDQYLVKVAELSLNIGKLSAEDQQLNTVVVDAARKREDEKRAADALKQATDDLASAQAKLTDLYAQEMQLNGDYEQQRLNSAADFAAQQKQTTVDFYANQYQQAQDYEAKRLQETADFYANLAESDAAYYAKRANEIDDFNNSIAQTQSSFQQNQAKEIRDFNTQQANNAKDLADSIRKIERDARDTELDEASRLDARAIAATQRQASKQIQDQTDTYEKQRQRSQQAEQQKLADQQQAENESIAKQTEAFNKKLDNEQQAYETSRAKQVTAFEQKQAREDAAFEVQQRKQDEAYVKQLRNEEEAYRKQTQAQETAYNKALYALDTQIAKEQRKAEVAYQAQSDAEQAQFDLLAGQQSTSYSNQLSAAQTFLNNLQTTFQTGYNNIITGLSATSNQATGAQGLGSTTAPGGGTITGITTGGFGDGGTPYLAEGDDNPRPNSFAVVGENGPELLRFGSNPPAVVGTRESARMLGGDGGPQGIRNTPGKSGGNTYNLNGMSAPKSEIRKVLIQMLEELGD